MFRNLLATVGGLFILCYYKPVIGQKVPLINSLPLPQITINWAGNKPTANNQTTSTPQDNPTPSPSPKPKRWGVHFELKSNIGEQGDKQ